MNKHRIGSLAAAVVALMAMPQVAAAAGFANTAQSGTATGMAGVATGNPDEPNANFYNPASMAFGDALEINAGPTFIVPSVSYESIDGTTTASTDPAIFPPPNFSLTVPVAGGFSAGLGVTLPWGLGIAWPDDWVGRENFRNQSLQTLNVNPNLAYKVPGIDLGLAVGVQGLRSTLSQGRTIILREDREVEVDLGGVGYGVGATAAAMYRPTDDITVGLNYRSGAGLDYEGEARFSDDVEGTPFEQRMIDQEISTRIDIPHTVNMGLGWQLNEALWLGLDLNYMTWSSYDEVSVEFSEQSPEGEPGEREPALVVDADWNDAMALRLGGQYQIVEALTARLGFAFDMTPVPNATVGPSLPDNNRYVFAAGVGYEMDKFRGDLGYNFIYLRERQVRNGSVDGDYQLNSHLLGLNLGYQF